MTTMLEGITVVEIAGDRTEWCGKLFSQGGARVILVEPPGGAPSRSKAPFYQGEAGTERSVHFWYYNTDKESVVLDLGDAADQEVFLGLLRDADILLDGTMPGELAAKGLTRERIAAASSRLVHTAITPFGQDGPWANHHVSDLVHLALGGQMMMNGYDDMPASPPIAGAGGQANHMAGTWAFSVSLAAAFPGEATFIDLSVHDACAGMTEIALPTYDYMGELVTRRTGRHAAVGPTPPWQYATVDGRYVSAQFLNLSPRNWGGLVEWLEEEGMVDDLNDPMYYIPEYFVENASHISDVVERFCGTKTADEIFFGMQDRGLLFADVNYPEDHLNDAHLDARKFWTTIEHEPFGRLKYPGSPYVANESSIQVRTRPPRLNEHGEALRALARG